MAVADFSTVPNRLQCDYAFDPLGVDCPHPHMSWLPPAGAGDGVQGAYRILCSSSSSALDRDRGDVWDSGRAMSSDTSAIAYAGAPLHAAQRVFWKVMTWNQSGEASGWSAPATFTTGLPTPTDWHGARWITDPALLRWQRTKIGYRSLEKPEQDVVVTLTIDLGRAHALDSVVLHAVRHMVSEGLGFLIRFKIEASEDESFDASRLLIDQTRADYHNIWSMKIRIDAGQATARFVRVTATRVRSIDGQTCFALGQVEVFAGGKNVAAGARVVASESVEDELWSASAVTDGLIGAAAGEEANATRLLRRRFTVRGKPRRALLFACGLGQFDAYFNGKRIGDRVISPGWTRYDRTALYETMDVTDAIADGHNVVGLVLAGGMYNIQPARYHKLTTPFRPLCAIAMLLIEHEDGSTQHIVTDETWRIAPSPITFCSVYGGEDFDARRLDADWCRPVFADDALPAAKAIDLPHTTLRGHSTSAPPVKRIKLLAAASVTQLRDEVRVYDFGQNASLMPRLTVRGNAGDTIRLTPAELLNADGTVNRRSCGMGQAYWQYTLGSDQPETWEPRFFYHGARYLQVESIPAGPSAPLPRVLDLQADVVHADVASVGTFACSSEHFNRVHNLIRWAQRSNLVSVISDCPHRERLGWLEQYHLHGPSLRYEFDLNRLFAKTMQDMADSQLPSGLVPCIAPEYVVFNGGFRDSPEWGSAAVLVPWQQYVWTGDTSLIERYYSTMKRYVDYLTARAQDHIVSHGLGDWYDIGPNPPSVAQMTPVALTATAFYFEVASVLGRCARLIGRREDADRYESLAERISTAFHRRFFDASAGRYATGSQTAQAVPLVMNMVPPAERARVVRSMLDDVNRSKLTAGDIGHRYVLRALADAGHSQAVFELHSSADRPGYGYILAHGATALTEAWDARPESSHNHFMLGHIMEWFYHDLAGIQPDPAAPGFRKAIIRPAVVGDVSWVKASYDSIRGTFASHWHRENGLFHMEVLVPPNTSAVVVVPGREASIEAIVGTANTAQKHGDPTTFEVTAGRFVCRSRLD